MKSITDIIFTSRTVWVGVTSVCLGVAQAVSVAYFDKLLPFDTGPELLILGGLAAVYSRGGKDDVDSSSKSSN